MSCCTITFYGPIATNFTGKLEAVVHNVGHIFSALAANFDEFKAWLNENQRKGLGHRIMVNGREITADHLEMKIPPGAEIIVTAQLIGAGGGGVQTAIGAALIIGSFFIPGGAVIGIGAASIGVSAFTVTLGLALLSSGLSTLLSSRGDDSDDDGSQLISSNPATARAGVAIPLALGGGGISEIPTMYTEGMFVMSAVIDVEDVEPNGNGTGGKK